MSLPEFQRALVDMTLDARLARHVKQDGAAALSRYDLSPREAGRLVSVSRQPGMALNCTLARANRFTAIADEFPMTCVVLEPVLRDLLDELWSRDTPATYQLSGEAVAFAARVAADAALHERFPYLTEIFRYEQECVALVAETRQRAVAEMNGRARVVEFTHDPGALLRALQRSVAPPPGLPPAPHRVEIELVDGVLETRWAPLDEPAAAD